MQMYARIGRFSGQIASSALLPALHLDDLVDVEVKRLRYDGVELMPLHPNINLVCHLSYDSTTLSVSQICDV